MSVVGQKVVVFACAGHGKIVVPDNVQKFDVNTPGLAQRAGWCWMENEFIEIYSIITQSNQIDKRLFADFCRFYVIGTDSRNENWTHPRNCQNCRTNSRWRSWSWRMCNYKPRRWRPRCSVRTRTLWLSRTCRWCTQADCRSRCRVEVAASGTCCSTSSPLVGKCAPLFCNKTNNVIPRH